MFLNLLILLLVLVFLLRSVEGPKQVPLTLEEKQVEYIYIVQEPIEIEPVSDSIAIESTDSFEEVRSVTYNPSYRTNLTENDYNVMLEDTPLAGRGYMFWEAEFAHGVNGLFLLALTGQEQGFGAGSIAQSKNNLTSFGAWDSNPHERAREFRDYSESIQVTAKWLANEYLSVDGKYFINGTLEDIGKYYASDPEWATKIKRVMSDRAKRANIEVKEVGSIEH
jgi:beta-N-acetylglucosaminidase